VWILEVEEFSPLAVAIDSMETIFSGKFQKKVEENKQKIYQKLGLSS